MTKVPDVVAVIPVYNHPSTIRQMVAGVLAHGLHCMLVDDGSAADCAQVLDALAQALGQQHVTLVRLQFNQGKGAAMLTGFRAAAARGHTHVLQIDADGQHATEDIPRFVAACHQSPTSVIVGTPVYDRSVPFGRLIGRYATHVWVWINTLSFQIRDSMCGFRVYPLRFTLALIDQEHIGRRMDFDTEILVRLAWRQVPMMYLRTPVTYPLDGVSHFRVWRDNLLISRMHARLFLGMLVRAPRILWRRWTA